MTSFSVTADTQSGQILSTGEFGFVAVKGSVLAPAGVAVELNGTAALMCFGALGSLNTSALVLKEARSTSVILGATGSVVTGATNLAAISGSFADQLALHLSGLVSGGQGVSLAATTPTSSINISNDGTLQGLGFSAGQALGLTLNATSTAAIANAGLISTAGVGPAIQVWGGGSLTLSNTGNIVNAVTLGVAIAVEGTLTLRNSGRIEGDVSATLSANIYNAGTVQGDITLGNANDTVRVSGVVLGDIFMGDGRGAFFQTGGRVMGCVYGGAGDDQYHIDRPDTVISDMTGGVDTVFAAISFRLAEGIENLTLSGALNLTGIGNSGANVILGAGGDDVLRGLGDNDVLHGSEGNNRMMGGSGADTLRGGEGKDRMEGGPGADTVYVGYGKDKLFGGSGRDVLRFDELINPSGVTANLNTNTASFENQGDGFRFTGFEDVVGTAYGDTLIGTDMANTLMGGDGADVLTGGGQGDTLFGGKGADHFVFSALSDSMGAEFDTIQDFEKGSDLITLCAIDAVLGGADDAFHFIGTQAFSNTGPEVRYQLNTANGTTLIQVHMAGSANADSQIVLKGLYDLTADSFVL